MGFFKNVARLYGNYYKALAGSVGISTKSDEDVAKEDFQRSKDLMLYQNDLNQQNWNAYNQYNTPDAIRGRMMAAGMNPLLHDLQGQGQQMQAVSTVDSSANIQAQQSGTAKFASMIQAMLGFAQMRNIKEQNKNIAAQTAKTEAETKGVEIANERQEFGKSNGEWTEDILTKWWNNELSSYTASELWLKQLREQYRSQVFKSYFHDGEKFEVETDLSHMYRDVDLELENLEADLNLKRHQRKQLDALIYNLVMTGRAAVINANSNEARVKVQNDLDELMKFMYENGFNPSDTPLDRMLKKVGDWIGVGFELPNK